MNAQPSHRRQRQFWRVAASLAALDKIWNGHAIQLRMQVDDMPAFKEKLSKDQVWTLVEYLKVIRTPRR